MFMIKIYIAGPMTLGDMARNMRIAYDAAEQLANAGFAPYVPQQTHFWSIIYPHTYRFWMDQDLTFLSVCDALLRLPGESKGADEEVAYAQELGILTFFNVDALMRHYAK